jgi:class 3 adenylate cyclase
VATFRAGFGRMAGARTADRGATCTGPFEADRSVPPIRVASTCGTVAASNGDYYGDVVNLAARLVAAADPGTVVATAEVVDAAGARASAEPLPARVLKGFPEPVTALRLTGC